MFCCKEACGDVVLHIAAGFFFAKEWPLFRTADLKFFYRGRDFRRYELFRGGAWHAICRKEADTRKEDIHGALSGRISAQMLHGGSHCRKN